MQHFKRFMSYRIHKLFLPRKNTNNTVTVCWENGFLADIKLKIFEVLYFF